MGIQFEINRKDLRQSRWKQTSSKILQEGDIEIAIDKFGFTANNITYANLGDSFGYWNFFPAEERPDIWGIIPTWGFGTVIESVNSGIQKGERFYGYFPTASHLILKPGKVRPTGFSDIVEHRVKLPTAYNFYYNLSKDDFYSKESEDYQAIFRPLFTTSFLLDEYLIDNNLFGAKDVLITSASSKTAIALAFLMKERREKENLSFKIHALTSVRNLDWVQSLGYYDTVCLYDQISSLEKSDICVVDFSGNEKVQRETKDYFGSFHKHLCLVGIVHWEDQAENPDTSGGVLFFAPTQIKKKSKEWGLANFQEKLLNSFQKFFISSKPWLKINQSEMKSSIENVYLETLEGKISAEMGPILINS